MSVVGEMEGSGTELISKSDSNCLIHFPPTFTSRSRHQLFSGFQVPGEERLSIHPQFINAPK